MKTKLIIATIATIALVSCDKEEVKEITNASCNCDPFNINTNTTEFKKGYLFGEKEIMYQEIDGEKIWQGDIIVTKQVTDTKTSTNTKGGTNTTQGNVVDPWFTGSGYKWPNKTIYYRINSNLSSTVKNRINSAINHWKTRTSLRLVQHTSQANFVYFTVSSANHCASSIGRVGGQQNIYIGSNCSTGNIIHEIGHSAGMIHEHTRWDRDYYLRVNYQNIIPGYEHNFLADYENPNIPWTCTHGTMDYSSIMMYPSYAFSRNGLPTITRLNGTTFTAQRSQLSTGDRNAIEYLYRY